MKDELRQRIAKEVIVVAVEVLYADNLNVIVLIEWILQAKGNAVLQASLERRKQALHERRLALEQDVWHLLLRFCISILQFLFIISILLVMK